MALVLLYKVLGLSIFAGVVVMVCAHSCVSTLLVSRLVLLQAATIPLNWWVGMKMKHLQRQNIAATDLRIKTMNEVLAGMKIIKLYAWQFPYQNKVFFGLFICFALNWLNGRGET